MKLILDCREKDLIKHVQSHIKSNELDVNTEVRQLDLGDIIVEDDNKPLIIFERKTLEDLCASIMDGRYQEQSFRLNEHPLHNHNIYYLIEGNIESFVPRKHNRISRKAIYSSLVSLNYHKGFSVMRTTSIIETSRFIIQVLDKIRRDKKPSFYEGNSEEQDYSNVLKTSKKSQITPENISSIMLMQIPGVSANLAKILAKQFGGMVDLIATLQEDDNALSTIEIETKNGKKRKISKTAVQNIKTFLL